ncbi:hypothetical protein Pgy4_36275 [Pseudomonas savastanoi pv. glycinea str. race 4]|uniref:Uncharacterized protein n=1 Tax=Pseudomonas savastanoi pv. glycinea str. race 4 TaxID=875330 RepID=F3CGN4_PSESG|nr:hypothetical protein Pgy4_36275 [Pseudomonas savastanoi pv. glycinea str. race 4]
MRDLPQLSDAQRQEVDLTWQALESLAREGILKRCKNTGCSAKPGSAMTWRR